MGEPCTQSFQAYLEFLLFPSPLEFILLEGSDRETFIS